MKKKWSIRIIVSLIVTAIALFTFILPTKASPGIEIGITKAFLTDRDRVIGNNIARSKVITTSISQAQQFLGSYTAESLISDRRRAAIPEDIRELLPERVLQLLDRQEQREILDRRRAAIPADARELLPERVLQLLDQQEPKVISDQRRSAIPADVRELLPERVLQLLDRTSNSEGSR